MLCCIVLRRVVCSNLCGKGPQRRNGLVSVRVLCLCCARVSCAVCCAVRYMFCCVLCCVALCCCVLCVVRFVLCYVLLRMAWRFTFSHPSIRLAGGPGEHTQPEIGQQFGGKVVAPGRVAQVHTVKSVLGLHAVPKRQHGYAAGAIPSLPSRGACACAKSMMDRHPRTCSRNAHAQNPQTRASSIRDRSPCCPSVSPVKCPQCGAARQNPV